MSVVCDSSPLILYAAIGRLDLIHDIFDTVVVPPAVWREVVTEGVGRQGSAEVQRKPWIRRQSLPDPNVARSLLGELGPGEAEALALAAQLTPPLSIVLDDQKARRVAHEWGLDITGSAGILVLAKNAGLIPAVGSVLDALLAAGLYLGDAKAVELLESVGE